MTRPGPEPCLTLKGGVEESSLTTRRGRPCVGAGGDKLRPYVTVIVIAALALGAGVGVRAQPPALSVTHHARALQPGEVVLLVVTSAEPATEARATAFGRQVLFYPGPRPGVWHGLVGIDVEATPAVHAIVVEARDANGAIVATARHALAVSRLTFPTRRVTVDEAFANPPASARPRIEREAKQVEDILARVTPERLWDGEFAPPVPGAATSRFGRRSIVNGTLRSLHGGIDLRAQTGTPVHAPARGRVVLAAEQYFAGNLVILDHGLGMFSFLAHLSRLAAVEGHTVERGDVVGLSGATGRVTGPHLHWGVRVQGARVDPLSLMTVLK